MLEMIEIHKSFSGVRALDSVNLKAYPGKILALIGINGAGKSTLMNILAGNIKEDRGTICIDGKEIFLNNPKDAEKNGISFIHQEPLFFFSLTVAENVFISNLPGIGKFDSLVSKKKMDKGACEILKLLGATNINPRSKMSDISISEHQIVEIARAFAFGAKIIIFDEPTSSLSANEKKNLFQIIKNMKNEGKIIIYISHLLDEIKELCDDFMVLRDGKLVGTGKVDDVEKPGLVEMIIGKKQNVLAEKPQRNLSKNPILRVSNLTRGNILKNISFEVMDKEILGIWGLMGSGRTELVRALFGLDKIDEGKVYFVENGNPRIIKPNILLQYSGYVTENRHSDGLFFNMSVAKNVVSSNLDKYSSRYGKFLNAEMEMKDAMNYINVLKIKTPDGNTNVENLSGGNQQKVIISKWINKQAKIFVLDEPTRGVDVGSKFEIGKIIRKLSEDGISIILISSEIEEIIDLADRVIVLSNGQVVSEVSGSGINSDVLMKLVLGQGEANVKS
jgi:ribose transport system ATP-binding protein